MIFHVPGGNGDLAGTGRAREAGNNALVFIELDQPFIS